MPRHLLYLMEQKTPAPAGDGDTESWFRFYKWKVEGETFVPRPPPFLEAEPGDYLWFAFLGRGDDGRLCSMVFGGAQIVRLEEEHRMQEIWYRGDCVLELDPPIEADHFQSVLSTEMGQEWLTKATRSGP